MTEQQRGRRAIETGPTGKTVAENLARLRKLRGLTTRQLSALLERNGRSVPASGITRMEKAERQVTADELMALAVALNVSPVTLLLPADARGQAQLTGGGTVDARDAWLWAWCTDPLTLPEHEEEADRAVTEFLLNSRPIGLFSTQDDDRLMPFSPRRRRRPDGSSVD
ncbi:helix-turn-helix domain-containing protein [Yinghuangia soli]|uniref:Helix-turn-helix domain-containing protein n=1 Tax=Yinghuangia soli TaxID=2908204 RepID=A0AA41TZ09_9ACTN|nr:helix-turn-helix transcriptional regulator [Yinghuangia soli]MCF2526755.1 helix-turn-helix domain-containing protein [Yinghuangia soli]